MCVGAGLFALQAANWGDYDHGLITTTTDTPIEHSARLMVQNKIGGLPVLDEDNRIVGVVTVASDAKAPVLARLFRPCVQKSGTDQSEG